MIIEWSYLAKIDYWKNIEYLENEWSPKEVVAFIKSVDQHLELLKSDNIYFTKTGYKDVYKLVIVNRFLFFTELKKIK